MNTVQRAFLAGYMQKAAEDGTEVSGFKQILPGLNEFESGRMRAGLEGKGIDPSFTFRHPILTEIGTTLAGGLAGGAGGGALGYGLGAATDLSPHEKGQASVIVAAGGSALGSLGALLATRLHRLGKYRKQMAGAKDAPVDSARLKALLSRHGRDSKVGAMIYGILGAGHGQRGEVSQARQMLGHTQRADTPVASWLPNVPYAWLGANPYSSAAAVDEAREGLRRENREGGGGNREQF